MNKLSLNPLLRDLQRNRISSLQVDRRNLHGYLAPKFASSSTLATYPADEEDSSETEDETWSSSSANIDNGDSSQEEQAEDIMFCWSMVVAHLRKADRVEDVILHDDALANSGLDEVRQGIAFRQVLGALPALPRLQKLRIYISRPSSLEFYSVLEQVVQSCSRLQQLILCDNLSWEEIRRTDAAAGAVGNDGDGMHGNVVMGRDGAFRLTCQTQVDHLANAIRHHPGLVEVSFQECRVAPDLAMDAIVEALSTLPQLEMINLTLTHANVKRLSDDALTKLMGIPTLQDVTLWSMGLDDQHLKAMEDALPSHPSLIFLSLRNNPKFTATGWQALCAMVQQNYILRSVYTDDIEHVSADREAFLQNLLYWNQCGRGEIVQSHDPTIWLEEAVSLWKDNPSMLYYVVREGHTRFSSHQED